MGTRKVLKFTRQRICTKCRGNKLEPMSVVEDCKACKGQGYKYLKIKPTPAQMKCTRCRGTGKLIKTPCKLCQGTGIESYAVEERVTIPKGILHGQRIRVPGLGEKNLRGGADGDLVLKIRVKDDPYYRQEGHDVHTDCYLTVAQAVLGRSVSVPTLYGNMDVEVTPGTQPGHTFTLKGYGLTKPPPLDHQKGDHRVTFKVRIPDQLDQANREHFVRLQSIEQKISDAMNYDYNRKHPNMIPTANASSARKPKPSKPQDLDSDDEEHEGVKNEFRKQQSDSGDFGAGLFLYIKNKFFCKKQ